MKKLLFILSVLVIIMCSTSINAYCSEVPSVEQEQTESAKYDVQKVIDNPDASDTELLRAILVCVKDIDLYVQFLVIIGFAIGIVYFIILRPLRYFLN